MNRDRPTGSGSRWLLLLFCLLELSEPTVAAIKVGILPLHPNMQEAADILTVEFAKQNGIEVVERGELKRLVDEQALAPKPTAQLGSLLGAEALIFLDWETRGPDKTGLVRLVGVKQGAVLYQSTLRWPPADLPRWAADLAKHLAAATRRTAIPIDQAARLSILNIASALKSVPEQMLEREVNAGLRARLAQAPELFVLERRQLERAVFEKELANSNAQFWLGSHLLDGSINRAGFDPKAFSVSLRLRNPKGTTRAFESVGARTNVASVIDQLAREILAALRIEAKTDWDPHDEALRQVAEAEWALTWEMWPEALAAAEAGWALGEKSVRAAIAVLRAHNRPFDWTINTRITDSGLPRYENPPPAEMLQSRLSGVAFLENNVATNPHWATNGPWLDVAGQTLDRAGDLLQKYIWQPEARAGHEAELKSLRTLSLATAKTLLAVPDIRKHFWLRAEDPEPSDEGEYFRAERDIFSIFAKWIFYYSEQPEDAVGEIEALMPGQGFRFVRKHLMTDRGDELPLGGWRWEDRKRALILWPPLRERIKTNPVVAIVHVGTAPAPGALVTQAAPLAAPSVTNRPPIGTKASSNTLVVNRTWKVPVRELGGLGAVGFGKPIFQNGKIWIHVVRATLPEGTLATTIIQLDPATLRSEQLAFEDVPLDQATPLIRKGFYLSLPQNFAVTDQEFFIGSSSGLWRKSIAQGDWQQIAATEAGGEMSFIAGQLYVVSPTSLQAFDPKTGQSTLVASVRRRPSATLIDELPSLAGMQLLPGPEGTLRLLGADKSFILRHGVWSEATNLAQIDWRVNNGVATAKRHPAGVELLVLHPIDDQPTVAAWARPWTAAEQKVARSIPYFNRLSIINGRPFLLGEKTALFVQRTKPADLTADWVDADLFVLGRIPDQALQIPLRLEFGPMRKLDPTVFQMNVEIITAGDHLLVWRAEDAGFWTIAKKEIEDRLNDLTR